MPLYEINPLGGCVGCCCISMAKISFPHGPKWLSRGGGWWKPERQAVIKQDTFLNHFSLVDPLLKLDQVLTVSHFIIVHKFFIWTALIFQISNGEATDCMSKMSGLHVSQFAVFLKQISTTRFLCKVTITKKDKKLTGSFQRDTF